MRHLANFAHGLLLALALAGAPCHGSADESPRGSGEQFDSAPLAIPFLADRAYESRLQVLRKLGEFEGYHSWAVTYDSDGLALRAVMNVPTSPAPASGYPVIVMAHGNAGAHAESLYRRFYSSEQDSDAYRDLVRNNPLVRFAREGFVVFQPDYRGHGDSENRGKHGGAWQVDRHGNRALDRHGKPVPRVLDNDGLRFNGWLYTAYYTIDVLNLVAALTAFEQAPVALDAEKLFAWGRSLGGDVVARAITCSDRFKAASLWAPATTSLWDQAHHYHYDSPHYADGLSMETLLVELKTYNDVHGARLRARDLDPANFIDRVETPVLIQVSEDDTGVRSAWSIEYHYALLEHGVETSLRLYPGEDHVFRGAVYEQAVQADLDFFRSRLRPGSGRSRDVE